jgi:hypothetical protein
MRNVPYTLILAAALASPAAFATDQEPAAQPPTGQYDRDTQKEGRLELSKADAKEFATLDKNQDGKLTPDEVPSTSPLSGHFSMLDTDKDGTLSKAEFAKHSSMK